MTPAQIGRLARPASKPHVRLVWLAALPIVLFFVSFLVGRYLVGPVTVIEILASRLVLLPQSWSPNVESVVLQLRLPRIVLAVLVGAGLSISGAAFQGMFRNPLVSPGILGVSAAAGFGAAVGILLSDNAVLIQVLGFASGIGGVGLTYMLSRVHGTTPMVMLVLVGVIVASMFSALISVTLYVADPHQKLPAITFWLLGGLGGATWPRLAIAGPVISISTLGLLLISWRINVLAMGDEEARALGVRSDQLKVIIVICVTLITASVVSISGIIGWVGLVIPHLTRMIVGPDHRVLLPSTLALGAAYLLAIDDIARSVSQAEIPVGILTAIVGAPFFAVLLRQAKGGWG